MDKGFGNGNIIHETDCPLKQSLGSSATSHWNIIHETDCPVKRVSAEILRNQRNIIHETDCPINIGIVWNFAEFMIYFLS